MSDLVKRLRIKAGMIEMGERIAWGSDSAIMLEAADALEMAAQQPISHDWDGQDKCRRCGDRDWYASATCTPKKQSAPDVSALVEALEEIAEWVERWASTGHPIATVALKALATYRKQGGEA